MLHRSRRTHSMASRGPSLKKFQTISLTKQGLGLKTKFPDSTFKIRGKLLVWEGWVKPREESRKYLLCLNYIIGASPRIWVVDPPLHETIDKLPHVYAGNRLCLYQPKEWWWSKTFSIAKYLIPWAILWIYYYEIFQITGEWEGGGDHPGESESEDSETSTKKKKKRKTFRSAYKSNKCVRLIEC